MFFNRMSTILIYIHLYFLLHLYMFQYHVYNIYLIYIYIFLILFNGIQLHIITVVIICKYIFVIICHYSFISGMLWASLDRLLGKKFCIKCIIQVPTKHPNERVLQITWKNQFIAFYRVPPKCETCMRLLPKSPEHWVQHQLVQLKAHLHLHLAAVFEGRDLKVS